MLPFPVLMSQANPPQNPEAIYQRALQQTQRNNFPQAIADLAVAQQAFARQNNQEGAYRSFALRQYLIWSTNRAVGETIPSWYKSGRCISAGGKDCAFGITYLDYESASTPFGGILVLARNQGYQGSLPIEGILDVVVVPKLRPGEQFCTMTEHRKDSQTVYKSIAQYRGQGQREIITNIRQAWRINLNRQRIESVPTQDIVCYNPQP